jgi:hypothetical protein
MDNTHAALEALVTALERRTAGLTGSQFERMVSPALGGAFVDGWLALGRNPDDIPGEWQDMADELAKL